MDTAQCADDAAVVGTGDFAINADVGPGDFHSLPELLSGSTAIAATAATAISS